MEEKTTGVFTSAMTRRELILTLIWLPIHLLVLPRLAMMLMEKNVIGESQANLLIYGVGALYMVVSCFGFLRRDFDPLCENLLFCLVQIALSYCMMMLFRTGNVIRNPPQAVPLMTNSQNTSYFSLFWIHPIHKFIKYAVYMQA